MQQAALYAVNSGAVVHEMLTASVTGETIGTLNGAITATATTITLNAGAEAIFGGFWTFMIGTEIFLASVDSTGLILTVTAGGRGYFGTTAVSAIDGATVTRPSFSEIVTSTNVTEGQTQGGFLNDVPAVTFDIGGGPPLTEAPLRRPTISFKSYGGSDAGGVFRKDYAWYVATALIERYQATIGASGLVLTSGTVISTTEVAEPQPLLDESMRDAWPFVLQLVEMEIKAKE